ncbi:protein of unknown function [Candidatus Bipolaricaulis anaerobius]|jgi:hypothetical protein|uniref:Uncharacterized protein n=1 Tax=Candidatus Bipolaricaulis anaerobius TaxID=2026885 RepID=A0A2X3MK69_9BACT|nr:protein of unknown function [Candidatus Bipolaricaulis anaerobius]
MDGNPSLWKLRKLGCDLGEDSMLFPPLIVGKVSADRTGWGGNDLLAHYTKRLNRVPRRGCSRVATVHRDGAEVGAVA